MIVFVIVNKIIKLDSLLSLYYYSVTRLIESHSIFIENHRHHHHQMSYEGSIIR